MPPDKMSLPRVKAAKILSLDVVPLTRPAKDLTEAVLGKVLDYEDRHRVRKRKRGEKNLEQLRRAVGAIVGNTLREWAQDPPMPVYRSLRKDDMTGTSVGARAFHQAIRAMKALGYVHQRRGGKEKSENGIGRASRFWPSPSLFMLAARYGVDRDTVRQDFGKDPTIRASRKKAPKVANPLRLKELGKRPGSGPGKTVPIDFDDPVAMALRGEVEEHNAFAAEVEVEGCAPPRWFRQFIGRLGLFYGRWHVVGAEGSYQNQSQEHRLRIRIGGEPVAEIDIRASYLSLLHGLFGLPLPEGDPYSIEGVGRDVAKAWINASIGNAAPLTRWPRKLLEAHPWLKSYDAAEVGRQVLRRYPFLQAPWRAVEDLSDIADPRRVLHHRLTGIESAIFTEVMGKLRTQGKLSLPMHDGLIVPESAVPVALGAIWDAGERIGRVSLTLKVSRDGMEDEVRTSSGRHGQANPTG